MTDSVRSVKNQYAGINAHLHSFWQAVGGWSRFHGNHITDLMRAMRAQLLTMGYTADLEPSLQIRRLDDLNDSMDSPESDVTIYDLQPERARQPRLSSSPAGIAEKTLTLPEALFGVVASLKEYSAVSIYEVIPGKLDTGKPVAWVELLSPFNKPDGADAERYFDKRLKILQNGIVFVELDYLHESAPTLKAIPNYRRRRGQHGDDDARAYRIIVIDPRPNMDDGVVHLTEFDVDAPIPQVNIPLNGEDVLQFDFGKPYQKTFEETLYGLERVDYRQLPHNFERYSEADQARIANRMIAVVEAARAGIDLEAAPIIIPKTLELDSALARIKALE